MACRSEFCSECGRREVVQCHFFGKNTLYNLKEEQVWKYTTRRAKEHRVRDGNIIADSFLLALHEVQAASNAQDV